MKFPGLRIGLRTKALLGLVVPVSVLVIILMFANESFLTGKMKSDYVDSVGAMIDASAGALEHRASADIKTEPGLLLAPLRRAGVFVDEATIYVMDERGRLKGRTSDRRPVAPRRVHLRALRSGGRLARQEGPHLEVAAPVLFKDGVKGVLAISIDLERRDDLITSLRNRSIGIVAFGLLVLSGIILLGVEKAFLRPLNQLRQTALAIEKGSVEPSSVMNRRDELGDLAGSINEMTERLGRHAAALERRLGELTVLYNISKVASSSLDLDRTLGIILESAVKVTEAGGGFIMLDRQDEEAANLELKASLGLPGDAFKEGIISKDIADRVAESGSPLLLAGNIEGLGFNQHKNFKDGIYVPVNLSNRAIGVIGLVNKQNGNFKKKDLQLLLTLGNQASGVINTARLFEDLQESYFSTIQALAAAIDAKDPYTRGHSSRVAGYSEIISAHLDCSPEELRYIKIAAYLHDIGKIGIEEQILLKPRGLTPEEYRVIRDHPNISARILSSVTFLKDTVPMVAHHHEHFDGSGYPQGLAGTDIPLGSRVIAVADAFDAMTSDRPYRAALSRAEALAELELRTGFQFDPQIVSIFIEHIKEEPTVMDELFVRGK